jgi:uncharacterized FlaG/YvyC family protein
MESSIVRLNTDRIWNGKNPDSAARPLSNNDSALQALKEREFADVQDTPENRRRIENSIQTLNLFQPQHPDTRFQYRVHDKTGTIQIALVNFRTGETVEEIPSGRLLDFASRLEELSGLVIEKKA